MTNEEKIANLSYVCGVFMGILSSDHHRYEQEQIDKIEEMKKIIDKVIYGNT